MTVFGLICCCVRFLFARSNRFLVEYRSIGLRRQENALIVIQTAVPPLLELLTPSTNTRLSEGSTSSSSGSSGGGGDGGGAQLKAGTAGLERALSSLVELSDIPGVFEVAVSAILAGGFIVR